MTNTDLPKDLYEERELLAQALRNLNNPATAIEFSDRFMKFVNKWQEVCGSCEDECNNDCVSELPPSTCCGDSECDSK
jgi:hypothetical protein